MARNDLTRRDFSKLSVAALGGMVAGVSMTGCESMGGKSDDAGSRSVMLSEPHVCRGLNTCKGKGATGENACAGRGKCATAEHHACAGQNACKGQGGCGENPGQNACKGKGACAVPLSEDAWTRARTEFENQYKARHGKAPGRAPAGG